MNGGFAVIDADRHIMEPEDLWDRYLEPAFKGRVSIAPGRTRRLVDGQPVSDNIQAPGGGGMSRDTRYREVYSDAVAHDFDPASNLRAMDREGVDLAVLFPTLGLYMTWKDDLDPPLVAAICRAYNNWLAEYCSHDPTRLKGVALIPLHDTALAVQELRRAREELGLVGIFWRPNPLRGRKLDHPDYFPIYETAAALEMPICVHEGARTVLPQAGSDRYSEFGRHVACHPLEQMLASMTYCADGVLERFPTLKVAYLEAGCGWLPYWLERMDEHWHHYSRQRLRTTSQPPSAFFKRQCMISCEAGEELVDSLIEHVGDDYLVLATDWPHPDAVDKFPEHTVGDLVRSPALSDAAKRKILWDNPARLYAIRDAPAAATAPTAAATRPR
jgi:predicted TIM-barrel fold metal-dependent hydrolase